MKYTLHMAKTLNDAIAIQNVLYPEYFQETVYRSLDYSAEGTLNYIAQWIAEGFCSYAKDESGEIAGVFAMGFAQTYYKQHECDVVMFYVRPKHRATGLSRMMVKAIDGLCKNHGNVGAIYTSCASGVSERNNKLYRNLYKKFGFQVLGTEMVKVYSNE